MMMDEIDSGQERHSVHLGLVGHQMWDKRKSWQEVLVPLSFPNISPSPPGIIPVMNDRY